MTQKASEARSGLRLSKSGLDGRQPFPYRITEALPVIQDPIIHRLVLAISGVFTPVTMLQ
jgi:hypothetical protein